MPKSENLFGKKTNDSIAQLKEQMTEKLKAESQEASKIAAESVVEYETIVNDEVYSEEDLQLAWSNFIIQLKKGSLSFLKDRKIVNNNNKISVILASNHEKSLGEEHRLNGLQYLRINLKNTQITLTFEVDSTLIPETKSLSVEDKFNKMVEQNSQLASLRQLLALEIDY